ncbi:MAG: right-handed parallel beta-helix repeat-containing protein [Anaerolineae bacterium]|nr:right-handed parallel beta-helix repeat-containing protein [Anaerolineae bacterium]
MKNVRLSLLLVSLAWFALLAALPWVRPTPVRAAGFVVNHHSDDANAHDTNPGDGSCLDALGRCTLRAALEEANAYAGADTITFANGMYIPLDAGVGALPAIGEQLRIDASSVWNAAENQPGVTLNGNNKSVPGLVLAADNCEVYGLFLINFTDAIGIYSASNTIGGTNQGWRNVIASNGGNGVILNGPSAHGNVVRGNWIGLSITGDTSAPNYAGVVIANGAYENTIGGAFGQGNYISGNTADGIVITGDNTDRNRLGANYIGMPAAGSSQALGNGAAGVIVHHGPRYTHVGGSSDDLAGNLIAYNAGEGVVIWDAHEQWVEANLILNNQAEGVSILNGAGNQILSNSIAGNTSHGVVVAGVPATGNLILANKIMANGGQGIELDTGGNTELAAPTIITASASGAWGTGCTGCLVHLFSDSADEGETYHGVATADGGGNWRYTGTLTGPNVTTTATDAGNNTSEFSAPFTIGGQHKVFLPFVVRNH